VEDADLAAAVPASKAPAAADPAVTLAAHGVKTAHAASTKKHPSTW
jgi:hypothetical protein